MRAVVGIVVLAVGLAAVLRLAPSPTGPDPALPVGEGSPLDRYVREADFTGAILVAQGDRVLLRQGYGQAEVARGTPHTPRTPFLIGSLTKQFTAAAILLLLTQHGFAALALQYFGAPGLPESLAEVPLEYFETALDWLAEQPRVRPERFGAIGGPRGGELALLLGAYLPRIRAVVAYAPSDVVWRRGNTRSAWTYRGEPLPAVPPQPSRQPPVPADVPYAQTHDHLARLEDRAAEVAATIPVERIGGPVMLISGGDDAMWPSALMSDKVAARLAAHDHPYPVENLVYPGAGHAILPPYAPPMLEVFHPVSKRTLALGGTTAAAAHANADHWPRLVRFLTESLR